MTCKVPFSPSLTPLQKSKSVTPQANWPALVPLGNLRLSLIVQLGWILGTMTGSYIASAIRLNGCFADSRAFPVSAHALTNLMSCSPASSISR